jgi:hypothetical protein
LNSNKTRVFLGRILSSALISFALIGLAHAASMDGAIKVKSVQGEVLVNTSGKYEIITSETSVSSNTKILLRQQSRAELVFPNGCTLNLAGGNIYKAGTEADCKQGVVNIVAENEPAPLGSAAPSAETNMTPVVLGAGALVVIGGAIAASSGSSKQNNDLSAAP